MNQKYLPIGSICTLKGKNKKVMITGFYSVEFNGNLKINDYSGCVYPEGLLLPESTCTFNHSDIEKVDFVGYTGDEHKKFNKLLKRLAGNEESVGDNNDWVLSSSNSYSKLLFDENGVVVLAEPVSREEKINEIKFDENGIVIGKQKDIENPFYKDYNSVVINEPNNDDNTIFNKIEFDENSTTMDVETAKKNQLNEIEFDENGIVVSVKGDSLNKEENFEQYIFDENGVVVSVEGDSLNKEENSEQYKFDENGTVVSE